MWIIEFKHICINYWFFLFPFKVNKLEERYDLISKITETSSMQTYHVKKSIKVQEVLKQLKLTEKYFAVLIDGHKGSLDEEINADSDIVILPKIAGG